MHRAFVLWECMPYADPGTRRLKNRAYTARLRERRRAAPPSNVCSTYPSCSNQPVPGKKKCEKCLAYMREYKKEHRQRQAPPGTCSNYPDCANTTDDAHRQCAPCRARSNASQKTRRPQIRAHAQEIKAEVLGHYGAQCTCCGEDNLAFLSIDHVDGRRDDGAPRSGWQLYAWLKRNGYPDGYRTLCMNCNFSLGHHGYCPHGLTARCTAGRPTATPRTAEQRLKRRERWISYKLEVFSHYGGPRCACCGENHLEFLQIDHIGGTGAAHRKELTGSTSDGRNFYIWLRQNGFPPGFRVLCTNCNFASGRANNAGTCPHEGARREAC